MCFSPTHQSKSRVARNESIKCSTTTSRISGTRAVTELLGVYADEVEFLSQIPYVEMFGLDTGGPILSTAVCYVFHNPLSR